MEAKLHNMSTLFLIARDYAHRRTAFGRKLYQHPLHINTLTEMEIEIRACTVLLLDLARQVGTRRASHSNMKGSSKFIVSNILQAPAILLDTTE